LPAAVPACAVVGGQRGGGDVTARDELQIAPADLDRLRSDARRHHARRGLEGERRRRPVTVRPFLAEVGDPDHAESRMVLAEVFGYEAKRLQPSGPQVLDEDVASA